MQGTTWRTGLTIAVLLAVAFLGSRAGPGRAERLAGLARAELARYLAGEHQVLAFDWCRGGCGPGAVAHPQEATGARLRVAVGEGSWPAGVYVVYLERSVAAPWTVVEMQPERPASLARNWR
ncbi:MAG: hypothetical protein PVJ34_07095 [Anaerolineae bacterium]|jgi:hypothetical protein